MSGLQLLAPLGLIGLVGVPLVIFFHMRHTTPVERSVPALRFWRLVAPAPADDARLKRPPLSLALLLQLLAVGALGLALARPALSGAFAGLTQRAEPVHLVLLIDGSTSMGATDTETGQRRFDDAKSLALQRIDRLQEGDVATVLVLGASMQSFEGSGSAALRSLRDRVKALSLPGGRADLNAALSLTGNLILPGMDNQVVVLTDGAVAADPAVAAATGAPIELVPVGSPNTGNVAIVESSVGTTGAGPALFARLANFTDSNIDTTVSMLADGIEVQTSRVAIPAGETIDFMSNAMPPGAHLAQLILRENDALMADNSVEAIVSGDRDLARRILLVSDTPLILQRALGALPGARVTTISTSEQLRGDIPAGPYDLLVFEDFTPVSASEITAPAFFVHPPVGGLFESTGVMTTSTMQFSDPGDPLLRGVDLTGISFGETPIHPLGPDDDEVVGGESGPLLYRGDVPGRSEPVVVLAAGLQNTVLPQRIAFPILVANIVQELAPPALPVAAVLGDPLVVQPRAGVSTVHITSPDGLVSDIAISSDTGGVIAPVLYSDTGQAGVYTVQELDRLGREVVSGAFVIDAGHPAESNLRANPDLADTLASAHPLADGAPARQRSNDLWPLLAAFGVGLLAIEWVLTVAGMGGGWLPRVGKRARV